MARAGDRLVEVERFIPHDGAMNTPGQLARGLPLLGRLDTLLSGMDIAPPGRSAEFANHIEPGAVLPGTRARAARIRSWHPTPEERRMATRRSGWPSSSQPAKPGWRRACRGS